MLLPLVTDQLSGQLDDHSSKPDHEACAQLLSTVLDILDRKDVVRLQRGFFCPTPVFQLFKLMLTFDKENTELSSNLDLNFN